MRASATLEVKLPTGYSDRGWGAGAVNVDLRLRGGWEFGREVFYLNLGHTWIGEDEEPKKNTWFYAAVWDHPVGERLRLLTELYWETAKLGAPDRLAASVGVKWRFPQRQRHCQVEAVVVRLDR